MICPTCNTEVSGDKRFCPKCGREMTVAPMPQAPAPTPEAPKPVSVQASAGKPATVAKPAQAAGISPILEPIIETKRLTGKHQFRNLVKLTHDLADFDLNADTLRSKASGRGILFLVGGIFACFFGFFISVGFSPIGIILLVAGVVLIVLSIKNFGTAKKYAKMDIVNDFRLMLAPLLEALSEDVSPKHRVLTDIDLSGAVPAKIIVDKKSLDTKSGRFAGFIKVIETVYHDPWCRIEMKLRDGCTLGISVSNELYKYDRTRKGTSGKIKTKTKWKKVVTVEGTLKPNKEHFNWDDGKVSERAKLGKFKMAEKKGARVCRVVRKFKLKTDGSATVDLGSKNLPTAIDPVVMSVDPKDVFGVCLEMFTLLKTAEERN